MSISTISPLDLSAGQNDDLKMELIDVRTPLEYQEVHAKGARNVPLDQLDPPAIMQARTGAADGPLYVICRSGGRGAQACEKFLQAGYANVVNVAGGTQAWEAAGLPVVRDRKVIALERQVRIAAGLLVVLGALLSWLVHPAFALLSAFVGAGLVYSGLTNTCGMGLLLARMPWNKCNDANCACRAR